MKLSGSFSSIQVFHSSSTFVPILTSWFPQNILATTKYTPKDFKMKYVCNVTLLCILQKTVQFSFDLVDDRWALIHQSGVKLN